MKKLLAILLGSFFLMAGMAMAAPITVEDFYWGGTPTSDSYTNRDVIGETSNFGISHAIISFSGTWLTVDIYTAFAGKGHLGLFSNYTKDPYSGNKDNKGIGYGDLFLASEWKPHGDDGPYYSADDHSTGTDWTYAFALGDRWSATGGTGYLYSLAEANIFLTTDDFMTGNAIWRGGQEVAVNTEHLLNGIEGSWTVKDDFIHFYVNIAGTTLLNGPEIAFHWGQTCGNDVIEGKVPVPEPATMLLLGFGLIGLAMVGRRDFLRK